MPIIYSCVVEKQDVCNESGTWELINYWGRVVRSLLTRIEGGTRKSYEYQGHSINYIAEYERTFLAVADKAMNSRIVFAFLENIRTRYNSGEGRDRFTDVLGEQMDFYSKAQSEDKVAIIQSEISAVKDIMMENISNVLHRGEKMEDLVDKTDNIAIEANAFRRNATQMKKTMWWRNVIVYITIGVVISVIIIIIVVTAHK